MTYQAGEDEITRRDETLERTHQTLSEAYDKLLALLEELKKPRKEMTLDEFIDSVNPYDDAGKRHAFAHGIYYGFGIFQHKEMYRHQQDIDNIKADLEALGEVGVDLSKIDHFVRVR